MAKGKNDIKLSSHTFCLVMFFFLLPIKTFVWSKKDWVRKRSSMDSKKAFTTRALLAEVLFCCYHNISLSKELQRKSHAHTHAKKQKINKWINIINLRLVVHFGSQFSHSLKMMNRFLLTNSHGNKIQTQVFASRHVVTWIRMRLVEMSTEQSSICV